MGMKLIHSRYSSRKENEVESAYHVNDIYSLHKLLTQSLFIIVVVHVFGFYDNLKFFSMDL